VSEALPYLSLIVAVSAVLISGLVALRSGRWRETDEARQMAEDIEALSDRLAVLETSMKSVATKEDVSRLTAEVKGLEKIAALTQAGVARMESHMMGMR